MSGQHRKPASIGRVEGTLANVACHCGTSVRLCLGKGATAWVCQGCKLTLALPDWSGREGVRRLESVTFWRDVLMAEVDSALVDADMEAGELTMGDVMKMREAITRGTDALLYNLFKIKYEGLDPEGKS